MVAQHVRTLHSDPQVSILRFRQAQNRSHGQSRSVGVIEELEIHPIETSQPVFRANPKIAVEALDDGVNGSTGESLLHAPLVAYVPRQGAIGIHASGQTCEK